MHITCRLFAIFSLSSSLSASLIYRETGRLYIWMVIARARSLVNLFIIVDYGSRRIGKSCSSERDVRKIRFCRGIR